MIENNINIPSVNNSISARRITWLVMWMTTLGQASMTLYLPAFPSIALDLHIDPLIVKNSLTAFLIGYGFSQLFYGPLSDHYGRKPVVLGGILLFCLSCIANVFAHSQIQFLLFRICQGIGCGATITIGRSILRDCFNGASLASTASYLSMGFAISLGISPVIGAYLVTYFNWRADFIFLALLGMGLFLIFYYFLPETNPQIQSKQRSFKLAKIGLEYSLIIKNFHFLKFILGGLFAYAVVVAYNVMTPFLIQKVLGYSANDYGWLTFLIALSYYSAAAINRKLILKFPVARMYFLGISLIFLSGLAMLTAAQLHSSSLFFIMLPMLIATFGQALIFSNSIAAALQHFPKDLGGKASALLSSIQMLLISGLSALMAIPSNESPLPLALTLIFLSIASFIVLRYKST